MSRNGPFALVLHMLFVTFMLARTLLLDRFFGLERLLVGRSVDGR